MSTDTILAGQQVEIEGLRSERERLILACDRVVALRDKHWDNAQEMARDVSSCIGFVEATLEHLRRFEPR